MPALGFPVLDFIYLLLHHHQEEKGGAVKPLSGWDAPLLASCSFFLLYTGTIFTSLTVWVCILNSTIKIGSQEKKKSQDQWNGSEDQSPVPKGSAHPHTDICAAALGTVPRLWGSSFLESLSSACNLCPFLWGVPSSPCTLQSPLLTFNRRVLISHNSPHNHQIAKSPYLVTQLCFSVCLCRIAIVSNKNDWKSVTGA